MTTSNKGNLVNEGKTKIIYDYIGNDYPTGSLVYVENKDRITAFDGSRGHDLEGKALISNSTNAKVFEFLDLCGFSTSFVKKENLRCFLAKKCNMIPLEWVSRRIATGSFLRRNPGVNEGYKFTPPKLETFLKDDKNNDPQWSEEQVLEAAMDIGGTKITKLEYDYMAKLTVAVFECLERAWAGLDCALVDMKIEFGIDVNTKEIVVSDVIDSDSWRLWPSGDKRLMKDKQVYRNTKTVTSDTLIEVKRNFQWVSDRLQKFVPDINALVVIVMGSMSDMDHCKKIEDYCDKLSIKTELRICSAHKETAYALQLIAEYECLCQPIIFIAVAGRSNGLGPVLCANTSFPVINCAPLKHDEVGRNIWSSLDTPSGLGCSTVMYPEGAALQAASILSLSNPIYFGILKTKQIKLWWKLRRYDIDAKQKLNLFAPSPISKQVLSKP